MEKEIDHAYKNYWRRKKLLEAKPPKFPTVGYWLSDTLNPSEQLIYDVIKSRQSLLDFGAGDHRIKNKMTKAGFRGSYKTLDHSDEYQHDFSHLSEINEKFEAILFLDVIEHLPLQEGLKLLTELLDKLENDGYLVLQTPNALCIRNQKATDMTHLHIYNLKDLWAFLSAMGYEVSGYRLVFDSPGKRFRQKIFGFISKIITVLTGCDYADNILLIAKKKA